MAAARLDAASEDETGGDFGGGVGDFGGGGVGAFGGGGVGDLGGGVGDLGGGVGVLGGEGVGVLGGVGSFVAAFFSSSKNCALSRRAFSRRALDSSSSTMCSPEM